MTGTPLYIESLSAGYRQPRKAPQVIVKPFSAVLMPGQFVCLIGPNGAGKSTLLRTIAGMQPPLGGRVLLGEDDIHRMSNAMRARRLSVVLTQRMDVGLFTGYSLVALGRHPHTSWSGRLSDEDHAVVRRSIAMVGAQSLAGQTFNTMSDGERQKIMIARALAQEPDVLVLDEPTAFLDAPRRVETMLLLRDLAHRMQTTILLSTHDLDLAMRCADEMWLLNPGLTLEAGSPEDLVLNGAFAAAFQSRNVAFNTDTGTFEMFQQGTQVVALRGEGVHQNWTKRALEREGYVVADAAAGEAGQLLVEVPAAGEWLLTVAGQTVRCGSVGELLAELRQRIPDA